MTLTTGLIGAGVLLVLALAALRIRGNATPQVDEAVVRVTRKNRPARKPGKTHVGTRADRP